MNSRYIQIVLCIFTLHQLSADAYCVLGRCPTSRGYQIYNVKTNKCIKATEELAENSKATLGKCETKDVLDVDHTIYGLRLIITDKLAESQKCLKVNETTRQVYFETFTNSRYRMERWHFLETPDSFLIYHIYTFSCLTFDKNDNLVIKRPCNVQDPAFLWRTSEEDMQRMESRDLLNHELFKYERDNIIQ